ADTRPAPQHAPQYGNGITAADVETWSHAHELETKSDTGAEDLFTLACPDSVWVGAFRTIADTLGKRSWPIFAAAYAVLSAHAGRDLELKHSGTAYHAMSYTAVIGASGRGKRIVPDTIRATAPDYFHAQEYAQ